MDKSLIETTLNKMKTAGVTVWKAFCRGGNYELRHNGKDSFNILSGDVLIHLKNADYYDNMSGKTQFEVDFVPYENIDYIAPMSLTLKETENVLKALSVNDPEVNDFLYKNFGTFGINTGSKKLADGFVVGGDGKEVSELTGRSAYLVGADADRRSDKANGKDKTEPLENAQKTWHEVVKEEKSSSTR